jgi:hypothetical protein
MNRFVSENYERVKTEIYRAAQRSGRDPVSVQVVAVSKGVPSSAILKAKAAGIHAFGENRVQEFSRKYRELGQEIQWHFVGHLQRNKVRLLVNKVKLIHSLDRWELAVELNRWSVQEGTFFDTLVQVNMAREKSKHGLYEEEVRDFLTAAAGLPGLRVCGLMTIAPYAANPEEARPFFRALRELAVKHRAIPGLKLDLLSMGMTQDFVVAVEEGANIVRVGTGIFGLRR